MEENSTASNVARAIVAALDWSSSPDARKAAVSYLESVLTNLLSATLSSQFYVKDLNFIAFVYVAVCIRLHQSWCQCHFHFGIFTNSLLKFDCKVWVIYLNLRFFVILYLNVCHSGFLID